MIGVTGTDGKTTTSTMIYHILKSQGKKVALISTVAAYVGDEAIETGFHVTSPGPWQLQQLLSKIVAEGYELLVLEITSHGIDQHRLLGVAVDTAVYTNVTREHLDYHKTYDHYLATKARMMDGAAHVILNAADDSFEKLSSYVSQDATLIRYDSGEVSLPKALMRRLPEAYNQSNALAAAKAAELYGIALTESFRSLVDFPGIPGRMETIDAMGSGIKVVVDFAHTPNALQEALGALRSQMKKGQALIAVYGSAGLRDHLKRPEMGKVGVALADMVVLTSEDPRTEDPRVIIRQMKEQLTTGHAKVVSIVDRGEAIDFAINTLARNGDTVGIFGKGHERSMNLDGKTETPWSDQEVAREALAAGRHVA